MRESDIIYVIIRVKRKQINTLKKQGKYSKLQPILA